MNQISLDINKSGQIINEPVVLRVGDKGQTITVNLLKDGQPYTSFTTATFFANKPSGAIVANDPANISNGTITYTVPQALVNEFGKITNAYFLIDGKVSTESFVIAVLQGVNISDDLGDYIPGMGNLNVIYDKWKAKLDSITRELTGIDAPKEVKNVIDNELKNYTNQLNDLKNRLTILQTDVNNLKIPEIGGRNYLLGTDTPLTVKGANTVNQNSGEGYNFSVYNAAKLFKINLSFTLSFDWTATPESTGQFKIQLNNTPWNFNVQNSTLVDKDHLSGHYSYSFKEPENVIEEENGLANSVYPRLDNFTGEITFSNMQLEPGNVATGHKPAPEDFQPKFTASNGSMLLSLFVSDNEDLKEHLSNLKMGFYTFYAQGGVKSNPAGSNSVRGWVHITNSDSTGVIGDGYMVDTANAVAWTIGINVASDGNYNTGVIFKKIIVDNDVTNYQTQRIFRTGDYLLNACPKGTDFGEFLKSNNVPLGLSIIQDQNTNWNWRIEKESSNYIFGLAQDVGGTVYHLEVSNGAYQGYKKVISNLMGQTITATDDTGKTVNLKITGIS